MIDFKLTALAFVMALVQGDAGGAHGMLSRHQRTLLTPQALTGSFTQMTSRFGGPVQDVKITEVLLDWPDRRPGDLGWAYVSVSATHAGRSHVEAVTVIVSDEDEQGVIRSIQWGRP